MSKFATRSWLLHGSLLLHHHVRIVVTIPTTHAEVISMAHVSVHHGPIVRIGTVLHTHVVLFELQVGWHRCLWSNEPEAFSISHRRSILDRLVVLFVVQSHTLRVESEIVPDLVADVCASLHIAAVLQPNLHQTFLGPQ